MPRSRLERGLEAGFGGMADMFLLQEQGRMRRADSEYAENLRRRHEEALARVRHEYRLTEGKVAGDQRMRELEFGVQNREPKQPSGDMAILQWLAEENPGASREDLLAKLREHKGGESFQALEITDEQGWPAGHLGYDRRRNRVEPILGYPGGPSDSSGMTYAEALKRATAEASDKAGWRTFDRTDFADTGGSRQAWITRRADELMGRSQGMLAGPEAPSVPSAPIPTAAAASPSSLPEPKSRAEYDKLPSGTRFLAPDGKIRVKP